MVSQLESTLSRKDFLKLSGAGLGGLALLGTSGCGGAGKGQGGPVDLTFSFGPDNSGTMRELIDRFNRQHRGEIQVEWRQMSADTGQYFDQLRTEFQAGGGEIDVIGGDVVWPAQFAASGWILDLSDLFTKDARRHYLDAPLEANTWEGGVYGVPWFTDAGMLYYRKDLLEKGGYSEPPKTWSELKEIAQKVKQDTGTETGFVFQGAQYEGGVVDGLEYIWTHGGDVLKEKTEVVIIDSPESVSGLQTERSMIEDGIAPAAVVNYKEPETAQAFLRGDTVFARNWPYMYGLINDPNQSNIEPGQVGIATLPVSGGNRSFTGLGGWNFFINAASEDRADAAWTFIQFMTAPENQKFRALEGGFLPTLKSLYEDQEILNRMPVVRLGKEAIQNARPRSVTRFYSDMSLKMAEQFNASLDGEKPPEQAIDKLQKELGDIVEQTQG